MSTWSIADTRNYVAARFGPSHLEAVTPSLNALAQRQEYARYHYQEVRRLLDDFCARHLLTQPLLVVAHGQDLSARSQFEVAITQIGAHALACVLSIHATADVMAFAVYQALGYSLSPNALRERDVSVTSVRTRLRATAAHASIADLMGDLCDASSYKHVAALANKSKHQAIVRPVLNEDWSGTRDRRHEVRFTAFKHSGKSYREAELATLLEPAYILASRTTVDVGNQVNEFFANNAV